MIVTVVLLAGCAETAPRQEQALNGGWTDSEFFPNEYCWRASAQRHDSSPLYWKIRRWCDQREMHREFQP